MQGYRRPLLRREDRMRYWIAKAAIEAREQRGRKQVHIAAELGRDQSTIARFEKPALDARKGKNGRPQKGWPRDVDETVMAYAADLDLPPHELWQRALDMWRSNGA